MDNERFTPFVLIIERITKNIKRIADIYKLDINEVRGAFYEYEESNNKSTQYLREVEAVPLTPKNTIQLPILADVPAGAFKKASRSAIRSDGS